MLELVTNGTGELALFLRLCQAHSHVNAGAGRFSLSDLALAPCSHVIVSFESFTTIEYICCLCADEVLYSGNS